MHPTATVVRGGLLVALLTTGCATTAFGDVPAPRLTDEQLVLELEAAAAGVGVQINRAEYLIATRPDPAFSSWANRRSIS